jgi:VCBS repeat-containing protein
VAPSHGTLTLQPDGSFRYTPVGGYVGTDTATYVVSDGLVTSAPATVTFTVTNDAPIAADDSGATNRNTMLVVAAASGVLANDTDANGDPLTAVVVTAPAHGGLTLNPDGSYAYVPDPDWVGTDTFTYEASDGTAVSSPATVTIVVTNHAPVAAPDAWTVVHDHVLTVAAPGVLGNDTDVDGDVLSASVTAVPAHGSLSLASDGSFTFVADPGYAGSDSFSYAVSDGLSSDTATVTITITNGTPVAVDSSWSTSQDTALVASAPGLLAGASDADGDPLSAVVVTLPAHGSVTIDPSGSFIYTPSAGYVGPDAFTFAASDGVTTSAAATASVTVSAPTPTPPPSGSASATPPRSTSPPPTSTPSTSRPPTSRPSTSPVPTATASVVPTPSGSASPRPTVVGTPSPQPSSAPPLPPSAPPSSPPSSPLPAPSVSASGTPTPNPTASLPPTAAPTSATGGSPGPAAFGSTDRFVVGPPGGSATAGIDFGSLSPALAGFGGLLEWAVPGLVMSVPGLLLVVAIGAQVVGASAWIPIIRRSLGVFGVGRRRRRQAGARP